MLNGTRRIQEPVLLSPSLRFYAWGDRELIPSLLDLSTNGEPVAEAWYGAHAVAPAIVKTPLGDRRLDVLIREDRDNILGPHVAARFAGLPYLLKILAAARPLSIQVHPNRAQARIGYLREEELGFPLDAPNRNYRDPSHKPELFVALTPFDALCGFRSPHQVAAALELVPELRALLPPWRPGPAGLRGILEVYYELPDRLVTEALLRLMERLEGADAAGRLSTTDPGFWALYAHRAVPQVVPDRGLFVVLLLDHVHLEPGQGIFLPPGVPHAYLCGAGVELMASSDNVLRAGLTSKHVDPAELLRNVWFDASAPPVLEPIEDGTGLEAIYPTEAEELELGRIDLSSGQALERRARGPETVLALPADPSGTVRVRSRLGGWVELGPGDACLLPDGLRYTVESNGEATVFRASVPSGGRPSASEVSWRPSERIDAAAFSRAIRHNIAVTEVLFACGEPPAVIGTVSGSEGARKFWAQQLERVRALFRARKTISFHEDLPVNQAFGILLLWQRLRPHLAPGEGALLAFVFGEGSRAAPLTEAECGQKPAIMSFVAAGEGAERRYLSTVELALRYFAPVERYLRRSGFDGMVVKWGDEVQIPALDLTGHDARFAGADVVRFVSMRPITEETAANKDWVGVDTEGRVTAFIPRRPLPEMERLAARGVFQRRHGRLFGGVNLGSIALSRSLLDLLLEAFEIEVNDPTADRSKRPDLDPQLFTALTIAALEDPDRRRREWQTALDESAAMRRLDADLPGVLSRLRSVLDRFETRYGRRPRMVAMDFGDQYWGDIGQHRQMYEFYLALREDGAEGDIARALAGLDGPRDAQGNLVAGDTRLGPGVKARNSVLLDAHVDAGEIEDSVLIGSHVGRLHAREAFDMGSTAVEMNLAPRSGAYQVVSEVPVQARSGERITTVFLTDQEHLMRVHEETALRARATTYDVPIRGNSMSFREAHERVVASDFEKLRARRTARRREVGLHVRRWSEGEAQPKADS